VRGYPARSAPARVAGVLVAAVVMVLVVAEGGPRARAQPRPGARPVGDPSTLSAPPPPRPVRVGQPAALTPPPPPPGRTPWGGPRVALGYARYRLDDGFGSGVVHELSLQGFLPTHPVRVRLEGGYGLRDYQLGDDDLFLRVQAAVGYELLGVLDPIVPYVNAVASVGVLVGERFTVVTAQAIGGGGIEAGADLHLGGGAFLGLGFSYQRLRGRGVPYDAVAFRLRLGL